MLRRAHNNTAVMRLNLESGEQVSKVEHGIGVGELKYHSRIYMLALWEIVNKLISDTAVICF